jgi:hypothetical protein
MCLNVGQIGSLVPSALWWVSEDNGSECKLTFSQLADKLRRAAEFFHQIGLKKGDRVLVITRRVPEWWIATLGLIRLGVVPYLERPAHHTRYQISPSDLGGGRYSHRQEGVDKTDSLNVLHKICIGAERAGWVNFEKGLRHGECCVRARTHIEQGSWPHLFHQWNHGAA